MKRILLQLFLLITFSASANHLSSSELKDYSEAVMATTTSVANGNWTNSGIWSNGVPNSNTRAIIGNNTTVNIVGNHSAQEVVVHGVLQVTENNANKSLRTRWIHVNSGGIFRIGTAGNRYNQSNFTVTLTGTNPNADHSIPLANGGTLNLQNNDGFLMAAGGGRLQFFGEDKISFTKLAQTANAGSNRITVANIIDRNHSGALSGAHDGVFNWQVGDQIVIASSVLDYTQEDVRTITNIQTQGANRVLTLNRALTYRHYGEIETYGRNLDPVSNNIIGGPRSIDMRAEVALLSRKVKIQGLASQDTDNNFGDRARLQTGSDGKATNGIGGHIMIMPTAGQISVEGVQLDLLGQAGRLGRYPFHWHIARDRSGDVLRNSSITNSNNRAVVVHTANNVLVEGIVAHDIHGHGFFTEDGVEENNRFINNIAFGIHRVHGDNNRNSRAFVVDDTDNFFDRGMRSRTTAAFWIANANNEYIGNVVAGSEGSGYWFGQPPRPRGASRNIPEFRNYNPRAHALKTFINNSAHSSQTAFVAVTAFGSATPDGMSAGEFGQYEITFNNVDPVYENFTVYQCGVGLYPLVTNVRHTFINFKAADNYSSNFDSDPTLIRNGLMIGRSRGNPRVGDTNGNTFYHGNTILENIHIAGFASARFFRTWAGNRIRSGYEVEKLTYENDGSYRTMRNSSNGDGVNRDIYDRDGSLTTGYGGGPGYSFMMSHDFNIDESAGDIRSGRFSYSLTKSRFANLQGGGPRTTTYNPRVFPGNDPRVAPRMIVTAQHGVSREVRLLPSNRSTTQLKIGEEYRMDFPDGIDFSTQKLILTLHQWTMPSNSVGVVLRMPGQANRMRPQNYISRQDLPRVNSLSLLRNANRDTYYTAGNGDLYVKIMNRGQGIHENYIYFEQGAAAPNQAPTVSFARPTNGAQLAAGDDLYVLANASDSDGRIARVQLFFNNTLVRTEGQAPYEWGASGQNDPLLNNLSAGTHTLRLVATDNLGATRQSSIRINVSSPNTNQAPSVSFARPTNGAQLAAGDDLYVLANASDSDGSIAIVQLFFNNTLVRTEGQAPYEWGADNQNDPLLNNLSAGTHTLRLVATDNSGATRQSSITVNVSSPNTGICDFTQINGAALDIGSGLGKMFVVGTNRRIYERIGNNWVILPDGGFEADRVDVGNGGQAMVVATDGRIYRYSPNNRWVLFDGRATDIGANRNALYVVGGGGVVYQRNSSTFNWTGLSSSVRAKKLDVYVDGNAWIVGTDGFVYQLSNGRWFRKGTFKARDIGISEGSDNIWALSESDGSLYFYEGNQVWSKQSDQTGNHISVSDDNRIWVVDGRRRILFSDCEANNGFQQSISSLDNNDLQVTPQLNQKTELNFNVYQLENKPIDKISFQYCYEDKKDCETISVVSPTDLEDGTEEYNLIHDNPKIGMNYYQVKVEYSDGTQAISNFGEAHFPERVANISIAPNPAQNYINIDLSEMMDQKVDYIISSLNGQVVFEGNFDKDHSKVETINLEEFDNGNYFIYTKQGQVQQFVVMKN